MDEFIFNALVSRHNINLVLESQKIINDFISNGGVICARNPDGTSLKLQEGVEFVAIEPWDATDDISYE